MRLSEIMSTPVSTIAPDERIERATTEMRLHRIRHLVVVERGEVVGVVSDRDLKGANPYGLVKEHMIDKVAVASPRTTVREAANLLRGHTIGCIPVVDDDRVVGIVTVTDLLELLGRGAISPSPRSERATLARRGASHRRVTP